MKVKRRKRISLHRGRPTPATGPNEQLSMDFVHDQMLDGRAFRVLTVIDQWSRESVSLEANFRLTGRCVGKALDQAATGIDVRLDIKEGLTQHIEPRFRSLTCWSKRKRRATNSKSLRKPEFEAPSELFDLNSPGNERPERGPARKVAFKCR